MRLEDHVAALASLGTADDDTRAAATRIRIRESLTRGHAWQRHAGVLVAFAILFVASGAWALATGRLQRWFTPPSPPTMMPAPMFAPVPEASIEPPAPPVHVREAAPPPATVHVVPPTPAPPQVEAPPSAEDTLYARAHELHFHGAAPADALAAWDAYLAAAPQGTFAIEARYNRALCLVRLGRLTDARTALEPFARGEVQPSGYRQAEAARLIERIDRRVNGSP
jgi:hypothetical protein